MSAPVRIPTRRGGGARASSSSAAAASSPSSSGAFSSQASPPGYAYDYSSASSSLAGGNTPASPSPLRSVVASPSTSPEQKDRERRASLMSSSLAASEHTVINVAPPDGPPRLISCVRSGQGFDWNQEMFLPSHYDHLIASDLERKRDPVHDIHLTEEDMLGIFPQ